MRIFLAAFVLTCAGNLHAQTLTPYGRWTSPISIDAVTTASGGYDALMADNGKLYAIEQRPLERGRSVIVQINDGASPTTITPEGFDVATRVYEYGGGAALVRDGVIYFSNRLDNRLYAQKIGEAPKALTPQAPWRYADCDIAARKAVLICVREDHTNPAPAQVKNTLVSIPLDGGPQAILYDASDFVASPRISEDGRDLAFLSWNHPNMPWHATALMKGALSDDARGMKFTTLIPASKKEAIMQPQWGPYGGLFYISDRSGYWNIYRQTDTGTAVVGSNTVDIGGPSWRFGSSAYAPLSFDKVAAAVTRNASTRLAIISAAANSYQYIESDVVDAKSLIAVDDRAYAITATPISTSDIVSFDRKGAVRGEHAATAAQDGAIVSRAGEVIFDNRNKQRVFGWYYPPLNPGFTADQNSLPPLITLAHGGPTSHSSPAYKMSVQFWTSRGFAVLDVNYSGSSGYGRAYRQRLDGQWGDIDVADVAYAAMALAQQGKVDRKRMVIMGGSAGGLVVLSALATYPDVFAAGINLFGVSDYASLATDTHKFESRYLDTLVGPYPKLKKLYAARSPINHVDKIIAPLLTLQGEDDKIVPPSQSERIVKALRARKVPVAYATFAGEGHGFRRKAAKQKSLELQMSFLAQVLGITFADPVPTLSIENWPQAK